MALAGYVDSQGRRLAFDLAVNHVPILGPNGKPSQDPRAVAAAFTKFGTLEAITTRLYESQRQP
jgi:D-alanyl-D-alanine carboxypeptidase